MLTLLKMLIFLRLSLFFFPDFLSSIGKIFLDETSRKFYFEHSFMSKTYFCDFYTWFSKVYYIITEMKPL